MDKDIEDIKQEKLKKMKEQQGQAADKQGAQREQLKQQIKKIASQFLTKEAKSRLGNIRAVNDDLATEVELQLVQLYKSGRLPDKVTDDQLKEILKKIQSARKQDTNIKHR